MIYAISLRKGKVDIIVKIAMDLCSRELPITAVTSCNKERPEIIVILCSQEKYPVARRVI